MWAQLTKSLMIELLAPLLFPRVGVRIVPAWRLLGFSHGWFFWQPTPSSSKSHLISIKACMVERGLLGMIKCTPVSQETRRILGNLCQEPGTKTEYIFSIMSHIYPDFLPCIVNEKNILTLAKIVRKTLFGTIMMGVKMVTVEKTDQVQL